jgi:hypothetical protein
MRSYPHATVEHFQSLSSQVHVDLLMHQRVGNAVIMPLHFEVIVDVDASGLPLAELITGSRQWLQRRLVQLREQCGTAALAFPERPLIESQQQLGDGLVDFTQREELGRLRKAATIQRWTT